MEPPQGWTKLRRQSTDLVSQMQQSLPSMPQLRRRSRSLWASHQQPHEATGSWQGIDLAPLPRSSHSLNVVAGAAYMFGGEVHPGQLADNDVHVIRLPCSGAGADYFCAPAVAAETEPDDAGAEAEAQDGDEHDDDVYATPDEKTESVVSAADEQLTPPSSGASKGKQRAVPDQPLGDAVPSPRLGHATAVIGARIFLFGGTASDTGLPLDEAGRVWVFDTRSRQWSHLDAVNAVPGGAMVPHPLPRSHHCAAASEHPRASSSPRAPRRSSRTWREWALGSESATRTGIPQKPIVGVIAEDAVDEETRGYGTLFIHAGCLADGTRASDIWAFDVGSRTWTQLPAAPGPGRANTAICLSKSRLFRFGGSDGERCLGKEVDYLPLELDTFDDGSSLGEVSVSARPSGWQTIAAPSSPPSSPSTSYPASPTSPALVSSSSAPHAPWPSPRTAPGLHALTLGGGREVLMLTMGMTTSSPLADVWTLQVPPLAMSAASLGDAFRQAVGRRTGDGCWTRIQMKPHDADEWQMAAAPEACMPRPRSHIASAPMTDVEDNAIVLWGGIGDEGGCLGDGWILRLNG
ncbi:hypothetical protein CDD81_7327 [Ophiocordyceps australis]|uniref:Uncharacterized protein n=1 Tax=Ophiocordyceps australis TaxID=1399860 RepID=A0A2C5Y452_9HYPO|nr:hypothetical protein CDD81_7327 [Ophiocordyceps australis]